MSTRHMHQPRSGNITKKIYGYEHGMAWGINTSDHRHCLGIRIKVTDPKLNAIESIVQTGMGITVTLFYLVRFINWR